MKTEALADKNETFVFEGHELLTAYATCLLAYLDMMKQADFTFTEVRK